MVKISIVIPNWNGEDKLQKNLPKVLEAVKGKYFDETEIIVVDDGSTDNSVEVIKNNFPNIVVIEKQKNSGFSSTVNLGVSKSQGEFVVLLNTDAVPQLGFLGFALRHFEDQNIFSVGCNTGGSFAIAKFKDGFFWHNQADEKPKQAHKTLWVSGGSGVFRKSIWQELGGLDTIYDPFYEEDLDIGYRALKRGYMNLWEPQSIVEHSSQKGVIAQNFSKSFINNTASRNQLIFIWKNITSKTFTASHRKALFIMLINHPKYWTIFLSALVKLPEILKKRAIEENQSKLTDEQVLAIFSK